MRRVAVSLVAAALLAPAGAEANAKRPEVVCFAKTVWVQGKVQAGDAKRGRMVRKRVCRPRRGAAPARFRPGVPLGEPLPATSAPEAPAPQAAAAPAAPAPFVCPDDSPWVGLTAEDVAGVFRYRPTRTCVRAGTVLFDVRNNDLQQHDLWVRSAAAAPREVVAAVDPALNVQGAATLTAGVWTLYCSIPGHESMARTLTVTPSS